MRIKTYDNHPFIDQTRILARAQMANIVHAAREDEVIDRSTASFEPSQQCLARFCYQRELYVPASFCCRVSANCANSVPGSVTRASEIALSFIIGI
jgi:hypothetical protein